MKQYATYLRVSTQKQGRSGLGLESQRKICGDYITANNGVGVAEFKDVESGTHRDRKGLQEAIAFCQAHNCGLVIAKLDRLCRDVEFCFRVVNTGIDIHFCDMPTINTLLLGVFAAVAQYERELTSDRTKKALAVKKAQGAKLGAANNKYKQNKANKSKELIDIENMKRGEMKRQHFQDSRDTQAFLRVLKNVFPSATKSENPSKWEWDAITTKGDNKEKLLNMMCDYKGFDDSGLLFKRWDFTVSPNDRKQSVKLCSLIQAVKRSFV